MLDRKLWISVFAMTSSLTLGHGAVAQDPAAVWQDQAATFVPPGYVVGRAYRLDLADMRGYVAAFPAGSDDPAHPGSAFDAGYDVAAKLAFTDGHLAVASAVFEKRQWKAAEDSDNENYHANVRKEAARATLPEGTTPCHIYAWSASDDPAGLEVHAGPSEASPVLGALSPPYAPPASEISPAEGWRSEFTIVGYQKGWFLIEDVQQPGAPYDEAQADAPAPDYPEGWVRTSDVAAAYANTQMPVPWLLQAPNVDAAAFIGNEGNGDSLSIDGNLKQLFACSANWALTESMDGTRGWWRGICSNQATNCS